MQNTKGNLMSLVLCFGKDAVFAFALGVDPNPMLCEAAEHVFALADVDSLIFNADFINASLFKLICPAIAI